MNPISPLFQHGWAWTLGWCVSLWAGANAMAQGDAFTFVGAATGSDSCVELTSAVGSVGACWAPVTFDVTTGFYWRGEVNLGDGAAEGLAFVLQTAGPSALGSTFGYAGIAPSWGVAIDARNFTSDRVGVVTGGVPFYAEAPGVLSPAPAADGAWHSMAIEWVAGADSLSVRWDDELVLVTELTAADLPDGVGLYWGWTAADGAGVEVCNDVFQSVLLPAPGASGTPCLGEEVVLTTAVAGPVWSTGASTDSILAVGGEAHTYAWTSAAGEVLESEVWQDFIPAGSGELVASPEVEGLALGALQFVPDVPVDSLEWAWSTGDSSAYVGGVSAGVYALTSTLGGCTWTDSVEVLYHPASALEAWTLEGFWDEDPGPGNGEAWAFADGEVTVPYADLSPGLHRFGLRLRDGAGRWGFASWHAFFPPTETPELANLVAAEVFVDADPGPGMGWPVAVDDPATGWSDWTAQVTPEELTPGTHHVYYRVKDSNGWWSAPVRAPFVVYGVPEEPVAEWQPIVAAEYFLPGEDPGCGQGIPMELLPGDSAAAFAGVPGDWAPGAYQIMVRVQDFQGHWSAAVAADFEITAEACPDVDASFTWTESTGSFAFTAAATEADSHAWDLDSDGTEEGTGAGFSASRSEPFLVAHTVTVGTCEASSIALVNPGAPVLTPPAIEGSLTLCTGDSTLLVAPAGSDHVWNTGATGDSLWVDAAGTYVCSYTNTSGFAAATSAVTVEEDFVEVLEPLVFAASAGVANGSIELLFNGTFAGLGITWSNGSAGTAIHALEVGNYTYTIVSESCSYDGTVTVPVAAEDASGLTLEYWWDVDPGAGLGQTVNLPTTDPTAGIASVPTDGLTPGLHRIGIRARDGNGHWGHAAYHHYFQSPPPPPSNEVVYAEVFIDEDPGPGNGFGVTVDATGSVSFDYALEPLAPGAHQAYMRVRAADGLWSLVSRKPFVIYEEPAPLEDLGNPIVQAEYFVGTEDPGVGMGEPLTLEPGEPAVAWEDVPVAGLPVGPNLISMRTRSLSSGWSAVESREFEVVAATCVLPQVDFISAVDGDAVQFASTSTSLTDSATFAWDFNADGLIDSQSPDTIFTFLDQTQPVVVTLTVDNGAGCVGSAQEVLFSTGSNIGVPLSMDGSTQLCGEDSVVLSAPAGGSDYVWNNGATGASIVVDSTGWFQCAWVDAQGIAVVSEGLSVAFDPLPVWDVSVGAGAAQVVFPGSPNVNSLTYLWSDGSTFPYAVNLAEGAHTVTVSNGLCSETRAFEVLAVPAEEVLALEYFIDVDPGPGAGTPWVSVPVGAAFVIGDLDISNLSPGHHTLAVRAQTASGQWGHAHFTPLFVPVEPVPAQPLVAAEYFYDADPGVGQGTDLPMVPGVEVSLEDVDLQGPETVEGGSVVLSIRFQRADGGWGHAWSQEIFVCDAPDAPELVEAEWVACDGASATLAVVPVADVTYVWTTPTGATVTGASWMDETPVAGVYAVQARAADGCLSYPTAMEVVLDETPTFVGTVQGPSTVCPSLGGQGYSIVGADDWTYDWFTESGAWTFDGNEATAVWDPAHVGNTQVQVTASNTCGSATSPILLVDVACIPGCTDPVACNYSAVAHVDDGSCSFPLPGADCEGCFEDADEDGVCDEVDPCIGAYNVCGVCNGEALDSDGDGVADCIEVPGCDDPSACNFEPLATDNDGSCCYGSCLTVAAVGLAYQTVVEVVDEEGQITATLSIFGSVPATTCLPVSCVGLRLADPDALDVTWSLTGEGEGMSGVLSGTDVAPMIWTTACPGAPGDMVVSGVEAAADSYFPGDSAEVTYVVSNLGHSPMAGWSEAVYAQSPSGNVELLLGTHSVDTLLPGAVLTRTRTVHLPDPLSLGSEGVFRVDLTGPAGVAEFLGLTENNSATEATPWSVGGALTWVGNLAPLTEGGYRNVALHRSGALGTSMSVALVSSDPAVISVPASVQFPVGVAVRNVQVQAVDNDLLTGGQTAMVTASQADLGAATMALEVVEDEVPELDLALSTDTLLEGASMQVVVSTNLVPTADLLVHINAGSSLQLQAPSTVTIPAGALSAVFTCTAVEDAMPESVLDRSVAVGALGHSGAERAFVLVDNDVPELALTFTVDTVSEGAGALALEATLSRGVEHAGFTMTAHLQASLADQIFFPTPLTLQQGVLSQSFNVGVIDNALDDGTRTLELSAAVQFSNCGCTAEVGGSGYVAESLTLLDNDGPALSLSVAPGAIPEGAADAGVLTIAHNSVLTSPLTVHLSASDADELLLPDSVVLQTGEESLELPFSTFNDGIEDGTVQVFITAQSDGFDAGQTFVLVTDQNKPDLVLSAPSVAQDSVAPGDLMTVLADATNAGFVTMPSGWEWQVLWSTDDVVSADDVAWWSGTFSQPLPVGQTANLAASFAVPEAPGDGYLLVHLNPAATPVELAYNNNKASAGAVTVLSPFVAEVWVDEAALDYGTDVHISGFVSNGAGTGLANRDVEVFILNGPYRREIAAVSDASGAFEAVFEPLANERGTYFVGAGYPDLGEEAVQDTFDLVGLNYSFGSYLQWEWIVGDTLFGSFEVENPCLTDLTGIVWSSAAPPQLDVQWFGPSQLAGGESAVVEYAVVANAPAPSEDWWEFGLDAAANGFNLNSRNIYAYAANPLGELQVDPEELIVSVSDELGTKVVEFELMNTGAGSTGAITLDLPDVNWVSSLTPMTLPSLASGESTTVSLLFTAHPSVPLQYTINGNFVFVMENGGWLSVPLEFTRVSQSVGSLEVFAVNQFTYFAEGSPMVADAHVVVEGFYNGVVYAEGQTDSLGVFAADSIPEGPLRILVEKEQHAPAELQVNHNAGLFNIHTAFLSFQPVTYWWNVVETEIEDEYDITLGATFVTHIPMPVLRMELPEAVPELEGDEIFVFNVILINDGLIGLDDVELELPVDVEYEFLTGYEPSYLPALSAIEVPVIMRRIDAWNGGAETGSMDLVTEVVEILGLNTPVASAVLSTEEEGECNLFASAQAAYECAFGEDNVSSALGMMGVLGRSCSSGSSGGGSGDAEDLECCDGRITPVSSGDPPEGGADPRVSPSGSGIEACDACFQALAQGALTVVNKDVGSLAEKAFDCFAPDAPINIVSEYNKLKSAKSQAEGLVGGNLPPFPPYPEISNTPPVFELSDSLTYYTAIAYELGEVYGAPTGLAFAEVLSNGFTNEDSTETLSGVPMSAMRIAFRNGVNGALGDSLLAAQSDYSDALPLAEFNMGIFAMYHEMAVRYAPLLMAHTSLVLWHEQVFDSLYYADGFEDLLASVEEVVWARAPFSGDMRDSLELVFAPYEWEAAGISGWFDRWEASLAGSDSIEASSAIDWALLDRYETLMAEADYFASTYSVDSWQELLELQNENVEGLVAGTETDEESICAAVRIEIEQQLTMTREAFEGTFGISNGYPDFPLDSLEVNLLVTDEDGLPANHLFEIQTTAIDNLGDVSGSGSVLPTEEGTAQFLFIPEQAAAPVVPKLYGFGGTVSYWDYTLMARVTQPLEPVYLTVNPSPNLVLDYFLDRVIYGDDALTEPVEPTLPAELSLMITNAGYGDANNVTLASSQPTVVDNELGLAVAFEIIGSAFQGEEANLGVLDVDFGTVPALDRRIGSWYVTSSLLGYFTNLTADVVHNNSFGNPDLSLIESVAFHELIHRVRDPLNANGLDDFLVNGVADALALPDAMYSATGDTVQEVLVCNDYIAAAIETVTWTSALDLTASESGLTYLNVPSPGGDHYDLLGVQREDGSWLPEQNAWLTRVTVPMSGDPIHEPVVHLFDRMESGAATYTLHWGPANTDVLEVVELHNIPEVAVFSQVDSVVVEFNRPIAAETFTVADLVLWNQGQIIDATATTITPLDEVNYHLDLSNVTTGDGLYKLIVHTIDVEDAFGGSGENGIEQTWTQFLGRPVVAELFDAFEVFHNPAEPVMITDSMPWMDLLFNVGLVEETLDSTDFQLWREGLHLADFEPQGMDLGNQLQRLNGFDDEMAEDGVYELIVHLDSMTSVQGLTGDTAQTMSFIRDRQYPEFLSASSSTVNGMDGQHVTAWDFTFTEPVFGLADTSVVLMRDTVEVDATLAPVGDGTTWRMSGMGLATYPEAVYTLALTGDAATDAAGWPLLLDTAFSWEVIRTEDLAVDLISFGPDFGYSSSDRITFGSVFNVGYHLNGFATSVRLEQQVGGQWVLLDEATNIGEGDYLFNEVTVGVQGSSTCRLKATGLLGFVATDAFNVVLDPTPLSAEWTLTAPGLFESLSDEAVLTFGSPQLSTAGMLDHLSLTRNGIPIPIPALTVPDTLHAVVSGLSALTEPGTYELSCSLAGRYKRSSGRPGTSTPSISWEVASNNAAPVAAAGPNLYIDAPGTYALDASASTDADGDALTFTWFAPALGLDNITGASPAFEVIDAGVNGTYNVVLTAYDGLEASTDVVQVVVAIATCEDVNADGVCDDLQLQGCTDQTACNFDAAATLDDGTCCYANCVQLAMLDAQGNGWNGNVLTVYDADGAAVASAELESGAAGAAVFCLDSGCYSALCTGGDWAFEVSWELTGVHGDTLVGGADAAVFFSVGGDQCGFGCTLPGACNYDADAAVPANDQCEFDSCGGCMYATAANYDPTATWDDGSCLFGGCTDAGADNYSPLASQDDGSCSQCTGCMEDVTGDGVVNISDLLEVLLQFGSACEPPAPGCTDPGAMNYDPTATVNDGSCIY